MTAYSHLGIGFRPLACIEVYEGVWRAHGVHCQSRVGTEDK